MAKKLTRKNGVAAGGCVIMELDVHAVYTMAASKLPAFVDKMQAGEAFGLFRELEPIASWLAFASAYIDRRSMGNKHNSALRYANSVRRQLRKSLGYQDTPNLRI